MNLGNVLITGANRGIGLEFIKQLVALPTPPRLIFALCRKPEEANDLKQIAKPNSNVKIMKLDVTDVGSFPNIREQIDSVVGDTGLNVLINNAGVCFRDSLDKTTKERMMENFEVNVASPLMLTKEILPLLKKAAQRVNTKNLSCARAGVVNISSQMGSIYENTSGGSYPYRASKTALNIVTRCLCVDLKPLGILAFALHPGRVFTAMGKNAFITTDASVNGMLNMILKASDEHCGEFFNYDGKRIPW